MGEEGKSGVIERVMYAAEMVRDGVRKPPSGGWEMVDKNRCEMGGGGV